MVSEQKRSILRDRLPLLTIILCLAQPILDVVSYWQREWQLTNAYTMTIRLILLLGGLVIAFLLTDRRRLYLAIAGVILLYLTGHVLACAGNTGGCLNLAEDLTDQIRSMVMPLTALTLITFERQNPKVFRALVRGVVLNLTIILIVEALSEITGTDPSTYETKGIGVRGWFIWTSAQSSILSIAAPVAIAWAAERYPDRGLPVLLVSLCSFCMLYLFGTRLTFASMIAIGLGLSLCLLIKGKARVRQAIAVFLCTLLFTALYPISPMLRNRTAVAENSVMKQERISAAAAEYGISPDAKKTDNMDAIRAAYRYNLQGMIDRFGLERVAQRYAYTMNADVICDDRIMKTTFCSMLREDAAAESPLSWFFGVELDRTRVYDTEVYDFYADDWIIDTENFDPENDFIGVLTLDGYVGLGLLAALLLWIGIRALAALWKDRKRFTTMYAAFLGAYGIALVYAWTTVSVLRRNNASFYLAIVLAGLWYLSDSKTNPMKQEDLIC